MGVLAWAKPLPVMTTQEWRAISADSAPPGVYVPNMSEADRAAWKAKAVGGRDPRVEIRKTAGGTQVLIVVRAAGVRMSMNGPAEFTRDEWPELDAAVAEARSVLEFRPAP
jgi:hypothetical protein